MKENKRASKAAAHKKRIEELHKLLMEGRFSIASKKSPAFQLYIADFLIGTMHMHINSVGPYIILLCYQWDKGFLPNDRKEICKIGRCNEEMLDEFFNKFKSCKDGKLRNNRLEEIRAEQIANKERASEAGVNGNKSRWGEGEDDQEPEVKKDINPTPVYREANPQTPAIPLEVLNNTQKLQSLSRRYEVTIEKIKEYLNEFKEKRIYDEKAYHTAAELRSHFDNYCGRRINPDGQKKKERSGCPYTDDQLRLAAAQKTGGMGYPEWFDIKWSHLLNL